MGAVEAVLRSASGLGEEDPEAVLLYAVHAVMLSEGFGVAAVGEDAAFGAAKRVQEGKAALPLEEVESSPVSSMSRSPLSARGAVCYTSSINGAVLLRVAFLEGSCLVNAAFVPPNAGASVTTSTSLSVSARVRSNSQGCPAINRLVDLSDLAHTIRSEIIQPLGRTSESRTSAQQQEQQRQQHYASREVSSTSECRDGGSTGPDPVNPLLIEPVGAGGLPDPSSLMRPQGMHFGPSHPFFCSSWNAPTCEGWVARPSGSRYDPPGVPDPLMDDPSMQRGPQLPGQRGSMHPDLAPPGFDDSFM